MTKSKIYVTRPSLAPLAEYVDLLSKVWESGILTHNGPMVQEFEQQVSAALGLDGLVAVSNGTIAIQMAIKALRLKGEIITSPFTWIATLSAIQWEGCRAVLADVDPNTLNLDPALIEEKITPDTVAILPVHTFGTPCDVAGIQAVADAHGLKVIYDAAHAVGSTYQGQSLLRCGDISATSFHATKLLNTAEGGGCVTEDQALFERLQRIRFFGHDARGVVVEEGFNGKMTEVHAALGLANLRYLQAVLDDRREKYALYREQLSTSDAVVFQENRFGQTNYSYLPVLFRSEAVLLAVVTRLAEIEVVPRRYFHPSLSTLTNLVGDQPAPVASDISSRILCLPLFKTLEVETITQICDVVRAAI